MRLVADSACDIKELEGMVFKAVPLTISTDNEEFCDDGQLDIHRMLDILEKHKGRSYTACPGIDAVSYTHLRNIQRTAFREKA